MTGIGGCQSGAESGDAVTADYDCHLLHPCRCLKNNVQITAKWGYSIVPEDIKTATLIQALRYFKRKDTPFNTYGDVNTGVSELFSKIDPDVQTLLKAHKKTTLIGTIL